MQVHTEFPRPIDLRALPRQQLDLVADAGERAALAHRFGIEAIEALEATAMVTEADSSVEVRGRISARLIQSCAISGDDFPVQISCDYKLRFVAQEQFEAAVQAAGDEIELASDDLDTIPYSGSTLELGEAIAQTLALEIDPYAEGPGANAAREEFGLTTPQDNGPWAALKALKDKKG